MCSVYNLDNIVRVTDVVAAKNLKAGREPFLWDTAKQLGWSYSGKSCCRNPVPSPKMMLALHCASKCILPKLR